MRTLAQIAKEQKVIAKKYFNTPFIKTEPYLPYVPPPGAIKKLGYVYKKKSKMIGEV